MMQQLKGLGPSRISAKLALAAHFVQSQRNKRPNQGQPRDQGEQHRKDSVLKNDVPDEKPESRIDQSEKEQVARLRPEIVEAAVQDDPNIADADSSHRQRMGQLWAP